MRVRLPAKPGLRDCVGFGTLPSDSHNTPPWRFRPGVDAIDIPPDFAGRTPIVDPDDHPLYVPLGCAAENVVIAANANGRPGELSLAKDGCEGTAMRIVLGGGLGIGRGTDEDLCSGIPAGSRPGQSMTGKLSRRRSSCGRG